MKKLLILILTLALTSVLLLSACAPDESQTSKEPDESEISQAPDILWVNSKSTNYYWADEHRPDGYNNNIGSALALMMELYKDAPDKTYHVVVGGLVDDISPFDDIVDITGLSQDEITAVQLRDIQTSQKYTIHYAYMTGAQITALAENGIKCTFLGCPDGIDTSKHLYLYRKEWWNTKEHIEIMCNMYGDIFILTGTKLMAPLSIVLH